MDDFQKIASRTRLYLFLLLMIENTVLAAGWLAIRSDVPLKWQLPALLAGEIVLIIFSLVLAFVTSNWLLKPLQFIWQTVVALSTTSREAAPNPDRLRLGRELVTNLSRQIYQVATTSSASAGQASSGRLDFIATNLPLPIFVIDEEDNLKFINASAAKYLSQNPNELTDKNIYGALDMSFPSEDTFDLWLKQARASSATAEKTWNHVKLNRPNNDEATTQFELAAYYNKDNAEHFETILVLFDQSERYDSADDQASFVALAVHELRNPLTMLRGYIEVLEEEVDDKTNLELTTDLQKMRASAKLLTEYTNNILNVSRVDSDQLSLHLKSENWTALIQGVAESMRLRAQVHGLKISLNLGDNLPAVGADRVSMSEVLTNLIDNAIKYTRGDQPIEISAKLNSSGEVETTVKNYGPVIGADVIGNLFQKFYRNHRSRAQVGGTGLGLYLSKALVEAQGGSIWVSSSEQEGTIFGFTVMPFDRVSDMSSSEKDITRVPHGWIKNHSLYRR